MTPIRTVIVDDEPLARAALRSILEGDPEVSVVGECSGVDAVALIARERAELLFLDIHMPEVDGFDVLAALPAGAQPVTVFVTAFDEYAVRAFEVHAIDYVLKPLDDARLLTALSRAKQRIARDGDTRRCVERFLVRERGKVVVVNTAAVDWIEATDYYVTLHVGDASHLVRRTMADLEGDLDARTFVRVHRGAIVNIARVRELHPLVHGDFMLVLVDGTQVRMSRTRRAEFERRFAAPR